MLVLSLVIVPQTYAATVCFTRFIQNCVPLSQTIFLNVLVGKRWSPPPITFLPPQIQQSLIAELQDEGKQQSLTAKFAETQDSLIVTGISPDGFAMSLSDGSVKTVPQALFDRLSFTYIVQLLHVEDSMQRAFYAIEAMRGPWSIRELQRQIDTNYYVRSGWSKKPELLSKKINGTAERPTFEQDVKFPYYFEFLGVSSKDAIIDEGDLEAAIVGHLKDMYIEYYRKHYMQPDDNPPVGLLLCTEYGQEMVEYLTPFTDPQLFVARYEIQLPSKEKIRKFLMLENGNTKR